MTEEQALVVSLEDSEVVDEDDVYGPPLGPQPQPASEKARGCAGFLAGPSAISSMMRVSFMVLLRMISSGDNVKEALHYLRINRPNERVIRWMNDQ